MSTVRLQEELSYEEAMKVLGFEPGAIVSPHLPAFRQIEGKLCELIESTDDDELRTDYREELARLNEALRVIEAERDREPPIKSKGAGTRLVVSLFLVSCVVGAAWLANGMLLEERGKSLSRRIETLAVDGRIAVENRRWEEAAAIYRQIEEADPGSVRARDGFLRIAEGKEAERRQKMGFLLGSIQAAIDERDWEEAEARSAEVLEMEPGNAEVVALLKKVEQGRVYDRIVGLLESAEEAARDENWAVLAKRTDELEGLAPEHAELARLKRLSAEGMKVLRQREIKARELYEVALGLDDGSYSQEALDALREAIRLSDDPDFQTLYNKMSRYARVLEVPGEFSSIAKALEAARENDKVRIAAGTYKESLILETKVDVEGAGPKATIIECDAKDASVVLATATSLGSRVAGVTLRQRGISLTDERFPVVAVDGSELILDDCRVENGAGHGVAVINGGFGRLRNVQVVKCGWDGLAVYGDGSRADASDCRFEANLHHGVDAWSGGRVDIRQSRCLLNGLTGIVLMSPGIRSVVTQCTMDRNREVGLLVTNGSEAVLLSNRAESNLLGGILVEGDGTKAALERNVAEKNKKVGILVDKRSSLTSFKDNKASGNSGDQLKLRAELPREQVAPPPLLEALPSEKVETPGRAPE